VTSSGGAGGQDADASVASKIDSGADDAPNDAAPIDETTAMRMYLESFFCKAFEFCHPSVFSHLFESEQDCVDSYVKSFVQFIGPGTAITAEQVAACAASSMIASCDDWHAWLASPPAACRDLRGTHAGGEPCVITGNWQCASGVCGAGPLDGVCATCFASTGSLGEACNSEVACDYGLFCRNGTCAKQGQPGETCEAFSTPNGLETSCGPSLGCIGGVCSYGAAEGQPCDSLNPCNNSDVCGQTTKICEPIGTSQLGESCGQLPDGSTRDCVPKTRCKPGGDGTAGKCVPEIPIGQPCGTDTFIMNTGCEMPSICIDGICELLVPSLCQ
jgi:hypothetical protein